MSIERIVLAVAGAFILTSVVLAVKIDLSFLWFTAFVGANLLQSAFTGFCPMAMILEKMGKQSGTAF